MCSACGRIWHKGPTFGYDQGPVSAAAQAMGVTDYTALLSGYSWVSQESLKTTRSPVFITYSFPTEMTPYDKATYPSLASSWRGFSAGDQQEARAALKQWGDACGITFLEARGSHGDIHFNWLPTGSTNSGIGFFPLGEGASSGEPDYYTRFAASSGDIFLNSMYADYFRDTKDFKTYVLLHEIGHALGFKHTFDSSGINPNVLTDAYDNTASSVMSYTYDAGRIPTRLGKLDIQAAQAVYGSGGSDGRQVSS